MSSLVSVIVPVYKVESEIKECLDSILNQTYSKLEIILVDDGSPDNCPEICDEYARRDQRIKVIHKQNGGLSDARNVAIEKSNGEYVAFVDSDDIISNDCIECLAKTAETYSADIVFSPYQKFHSTSELFIDSRIIEPEILVKSRDEALELLLYQNRVFHTGAPCKIIKKDLFKEIRFPVGYYYEDLATTYRLLLLSEIVVGVNKRMYGYRIRQDSIMRQSYSPKMLSCIPVSQSLYSDISSQTPQLVKAAASRAFSVNRAVFLSLPFERKTERARIWLEIKKYRSFVLSEPKARKRERLMAALSFLGKNVFHLMSPLYRRQQMSTN